MPTGKKPFTVTPRPRPTTETSAIRFGDDLDILTSASGDANDTYAEMQIEEQESVKAKKPNSTIAKKPESVKESHPSWPNRGLKRCPNCDREMRKLAADQDINDYVLYHQAITEFLERHRRLPPTHS